MTLREQLLHDGFAVVRGVVPTAEVAALAEAFDALIAIARTLEGPTDVGGARFVVDPTPFRLHRVVWCGGASEVLARCGSDPRFVELAAAALGSADLVQLIQQAHFKLPGDGVGFGWHQDASNRRYGSAEWTDVDGCGSFVQLGLAIDPMSADNGGLQFLAGTHALGFVADPLTGTLPEGLVEKYPPVSPDLDPGDIVVFGPFVIHGSGPNEGAIPRRLFLQGYALPGANGRVYPGCGLGVPRRARPATVP